MKLVSHIDMLSQRNFVYYLYEKNDDSYMVSLVSPKEWGGTGPFKKFIATVQLLADHTWKEL